MMMQLTLFAQPPAPAKRGQHPHSRAARAEYGTVHDGRKMAIFRWLRDHGPATDRVVLAGLYPEREDLNLVRPRINDLIRDGLIRVQGREKDAQTGIPVRVTAVISL